MDTQTITVKLPADILLMLNESEKELGQQLRLSLALRLYGQQKKTIYRRKRSEGESFNR